MNVVRENIDGQTALLKVSVAEADYNPAVEKALKEYKRKANIPGFRPGMVPMGVVNKMYRKGAIAEEAYRIASKACSDYIDAEKIEFVGDLLPSEQQQALDFENNTEHEFIFEFGIAPKVEMELSASDEVTLNKIEISEDMRAGFTTNYLRKFGKLVDVETVEKDEALNVTLDSEAMQIEEAYVGLISMSDEERAPFIGMKVGDTMDVNVNELYKTASQRASILSVKEEELDTIDPNFKLTLTKIRKFAEPELNDEFFKMAFPEGEITDEAGFKAMIDAQISVELDRESNYMFNINMRKYLQEKANLTLPEAFLKRWLHAINEGRFSMEEIERDFGAFVDMMKWNLVQKHYVKEFDITVSKEDALEEAKNLAMMQFAQYGMGQVADDMLENYANSMLENREEAKKIYERLYEYKVLEALKPQITIKEATVSAEEFGKLAEALNN
ncbi:MAG: trigger factor [Rikenellaceae bacterium]